ncbi:uncharacterized protein LOC120327965 [Styela clava]|uniref:uncharacterized protein LOC120327965 n=1 Tax=Styela clava TaxID=7725 RepID=UPI001939A5BC|nr:uncharacterized protein LOC120327965 [Styela clava]
MFQKILTPCENLESLKCSRTIRIAIRDDHKPDILKLSKLGIINYQVEFRQQKCNWPEDIRHQCIWGAANELQLLNNLELSFMILLCVLSVVCSIILYFCITRRRETKITELKIGEGNSDSQSSSDNSQNSESESSEHRMNLGKSMKTNDDGENECRLEEISSNSADAKNKMNENEDAEIPKKKKKERLNSS